ncbi:Metallo-dependent phosphatase-like protein [Jimgerdemannia flammicorona]|uniref:Metallo-dependent phosphatase-like protein n=1 Tax=Jimgerdemannia flammicorona TaxID=994334 RepID=A0A433QKR6_9FUNG|nr:Metallo-dependent phosphatase-like protein [Jimgerdemannia flammicorona]
MSTAENSDPNILTSFQFVSDIHLEYYPQHKPHTWPSISPLAPILILAGDIGQACQPSYHDFLASCSTSFDHVLVVAGNHEFYQPTKPVLTVTEVLETIQSICDAFPNVTFLNKTAIVIDGVRFLGTTMWTQVHPKDQATVAAYMNDYHKIFIERPESQSASHSKKYGGWRIATVDDTQSWHQDQRDWLARELANPSDATALPTVIVTHHAPSFHHLETNHTAEKGFKTAYASDLTEMMRNPPVVAWISGHTHSITKKVLGGGNGVLCVSNCAGYPRARVQGYETGKIMVLKKGDSGVTVAEMI